MANSLKIKKISFLFIIALLILSFSSCKKKDAIKFNFASYATAKKVPYDIYYNDDYFNNPASEYNPSLASASACLALAGFSATASTDFDNSGDNASDLLKSLGFDKYKSNKDGISKPRADSFGVYIASKKLNDSTLIAITVRGAGYLAEWASNFTIGHNNKFAQGFYDASEIYLTALREYINEFNIKGKIKIWTSGYSRGGAAVNIAAGRIDDGLYENMNIISDNVQYTKDDIYAYSFEPPAGRIIQDTKSNEIFEKGINYSNIYSVLNLNDPVPFVAPINYSFVRYGTDLFLPDIITDLDYENQINLVKAKMNKLKNKDTIGTYSINNFTEASLFTPLNRINNRYVNPSLHVYLNDLIALLCNVLGNKDNYVDSLQTTITELFKFIYTNVSPKESIINLGINFGKSILLEDSDEVLFYDIQHNLDKFAKDFDPLLFNALKKYDLNLTHKEIENVIKGISKLLYNLLLAENGISIIKPLISQTNIKALGSAHIPELLLCHISSLDSHYESSNLKVKESYNILNIHTEGNFELKINGKTYIYFENNEIRSSLAIKKLSDGYSIYLPSDAEFEINNNNKDLIYSLYNHNPKYLEDRLLDVKAIGGVK